MKLKKLRPHDHPDLSDYVVHLVGRTGKRVDEVKDGNGRQTSPRSGNAGEKTDAEVVAAYKQAGFKTVPIDTSVLSNDGDGSLHCITMTYPKVPFADLLQRLGVSEL